jgi:hypothetical protein
MFAAIKNHVQFRLWLSMSPMATHLNAGWAEPLELRTLVLSNLRVSILYRATPAMVYRDIGPFGSAPGLQDLQIFQNTPFELSLYGTYATPQISVGSVFTRGAS